LSLSGDREGIERSVDDEGRRKREAGRGLFQLGSKIISSQALPDPFLRARGNAECREIRGVVEIAEIAGDRQLESPALVGSGIALAQAAGTQHVALALDLRSRHAAREFVFELPPVLGGQRGGSK